MNAAAPLSMNHLKGDSPIAEENLGIWRTWRLMREQWPVNLKKVDAGIDHYAGDCACCKNPVPDENLRGTVALVGDDCHQIDMLGYCEPCRTLTRFKLVLKSHQGEAILQCHVNGEWVTRDLASSDTLKERLVRLGTRLRNLAP